MNKEGRQVQRVNGFGALRGSDGIYIGVGRDGGEGGE